MKKNILFSIVAFLFFNTIFSQINKDGIPIITKYTDKDYGAAGQIWAIEQDNRGVMYFGCNYGLKTYDGVNWKSYNNPYSTIVRSLAVDDNGIVFYGAESDFGFLSPNKNGELTFFSIFNKRKTNDSINFSSVWYTRIANNKVYFQANERLFYVNLPIKFGKNDSTITNKLHTIKPSTQFHTSFSVNGRLYVREKEKGLYIIENDSLKLIKGGEKFANLRIYTILPYEKNKILIGTREEGFFIYDETRKNPIKNLVIGNNNEEILSSGLYGATKLNNGSYVIQTLGNGLFVINKNGTILNHYNQDTGLPNSYILSMFYNNKKANSQLWFTYPDFGIFKANLSGQFNIWDTNLGIGAEGFVSDLIKFNGKTYAISNNSLYVIKEENSQLKFFKAFSTRMQMWQLYEFKVEGTDISKLLIASASGVYELNDTVVNNITQIRARVLYQSKKDPSVLYIGGVNGLNIIKYKDEKWTKPEKAKGVNLEVMDILEDDSTICLSISGKGVSFLKDLNDDINILDKKNGLTLSGRDMFFQTYKNKVLITNGNGIFQKYSNDSIIPFFDFGKKYSMGTKGVYKIQKIKDEFWLSTYNNNSDQSIDNKIEKVYPNNNFSRDTSFANLLQLGLTYNLFEDNQYVWILNEKGLYKYNTDITVNNNITYNTIITKVLTKNDSVLFSGNFFNKSEEGISLINAQSNSDIPVLKFKTNLLVFDWASPYFVKENKTKYSYRLIGESDVWSKWNTKTQIRYTNIKEGDYSFEVKARNIFDVESTIARYSFTILPPWYRTWWAYLLYVLVGFLSIYISIKLYTKKLKRENEKLEQIVKERTAEIRQQNEEITAQRDEIHKQKDVVEKAKDKIEKQKESIMDSIHYASRIQEAVLPPEEYLNQILGEHFVLFRPRDIVSGDFYWATRRKNKTIIVAADSTGHGVPGAFMSMLGMSFLNEIINKDEVLEANIILNRLRNNVKRSLRQTGKENEAKDGMDIALCVIDTDEMKLQFAGAYNPLYLLRNNEIIRVKADRMPIGIYLREKESFTNNIIDLQKGDLLYIFSDGYVDQFGGKKDSKIKSAKFKEILLENCKKPMEQQKAALVNFLEDWMDNYDKKGRKYSQIDDILVIGIEI